MNSNDFCGPLVALGKRRFTKPSDIPGVDRDRFDLDCYRGFSDESEVTVEWNGVRLLHKTGWNDYYGFGTSAENLFEDMRRTLERLVGGPDCEIITTVSAQLYFLSRDLPLYNGSQRVSGIPRGWESDIEKAEPRAFTVWRNGALTDDAGLFLETVKELSRQDAAPARNGPLRTIHTRRAAIGPLFDPLRQSGALPGYCGEGE